MRSKLVLVLVIAVFLLIGVQTVLKPFKEIPLSGAQFIPEQTRFTIKSWLNSSFQNSTEDSLRKTFGFRPHFVRFHNQVQYSFFNELNPQVKQLGDTLYEVGYLPSINGDDFLGEELILKKVDSLLAFKQYLSSKKKELILVIAPNKWRSFNAVSQLNKRTNYHSFIQKLKGNNVHVIDALDYFNKHALTSTIPLHSKQGTHWSIYGGFKVAQQLRDSIASFGIEIPLIQVDTIETDKPRNTDKDLYDLLNLMLPPKKEELSYPVLSFSDDKKPTALVVGDSYYWTMYYLGIHQGLFSDQSAFFYYNRSLIEQDQNEKQSLTNDIRIEKLNQSDIVVLVMSEPSLKWFGFDTFKWK